MTSKRQTLPDIAFKWSICLDSF